MIPSTMLLVVRWHETRGPEDSRYVGVSHACATFTATGDLLVRPMVGDHIVIGEMGQLVIDHPIHDLDSGRFRFEVTAGIASTPTEANDYLRDLASAFNAKGWDVDEIKLAPGTPDPDDKP
jgi:hypothetical protein